MMHGVRLQGMPQISLLTTAYPASIPHRAASLAELRFLREAATAGRPLKLHGAALSALRPPYAAVQHAPAWLTAICSLAEPLHSSTWANPHPGHMPELAAGPTGGSAPATGGGTGAGGTDVARVQAGQWLPQIASPAGDAAAAEALAGELMAATGTCFERIVAELHRVRTSLDIVCKQLPMPLSSFCQAHSVESYVENL